MNGKAQVGHSYSIAPANPTDTDSIFLMANFVEAPFTNYDITSFMYTNSYYSSEIGVHIYISTNILLYSTGFPEIETHSIFLGTKIPGNYEVVCVIDFTEIETPYSDLPKDTLYFTVQETSDCNQTITEQNIPLSLTQGWNMIGYTCVEPLNVIEVFSSVEDKIIIVKDNIGNAYLPEFGYNGIGDLEFAKGYQLKITEDINDLYFCPTLIQSE
jgi:hypothetical protein